MESPTTDVSGAVSDTCGKIYKNKRDLVDHLDTHNGDEYCCDLCGNVFSSKRKIFKHVQKYHAYKFNCKECSITCKTSTSLKNHYMKVHEGKVFECSTCSGDFGI